MMLRKFAVVFVAMLLAGSTAAAQAPQEIRLWPGKAPGSEAWTVAETATTSKSGTELK